MQKATFLTVTRATGDEPSITISTSAKDRDGDVLDPTGCVLDNYKRNPVVLFGHDYSSLPVGSTTAIDVQTNGLRASWRWLKNDPVADRVRNAFDQGVLRAASVGFKPIDAEPMAGGGIRYRSWELLEWSLVPVPANQDAVRTLKRLGLSRESDMSWFDFDDDDIPDLTPYQLATMISAAIRELMPRVQAEVRREIPTMVRREMFRAISRARGRIDDGLL